MKVLTAVSGNCKSIRACERACATALHKSEDTALSAIRVTESGGARTFTFCNQCGDCMAVCPTRALYRNKAGMVLVKKSLCVGCLVCVGFCPIGAMFWHPEVDVPIKCISCGRCVKACPEHVLSLVEQDHSGLPA